MIVVDHPMENQHSRARSPTFHRSETTAVIAEDYNQFGANPSVAALHSEKYPLIDRLATLFTLISMPSQINARLSHRAVVST
jgi:hypothetical protein